ncbi:hypothetical protein [Lacinutrix sp. 5H-3-7-4]|uniref:hypothetical protein n=1 Tax=Lacinutrix sp. (strain 5H-3-7-4) TaxID=983544 RepID=UPI00020A33DB|nr:hypothetical protein [Lacinutrix sp. 5H-3-7-4]AEH01411.1 hypothetical protein Lacal_1563 [Lacinutrix sp. 5H-3-7-4]
MREKLIVNLNDFRQEEIEIYISKNNDTITNQYKVIENGVIDSLNSLFYILKIKKSNKEGYYNANISLHSEYEKLELDEENKRTLSFYYLEQKADRLYDSISSITTTVDNALEFEFENQYDDILIGLLAQEVIRDTVVNGEEMLNYRMTYLLVDNHTITDNIFLESHELDKEKKFNPDGIKLEIRE